MEERTGPPSVIVAAARLQRGRLGHLVHRGGGPRRHRRPPSFNGAASVTEAEGEAHRRDPRAVAASTGPPRSPRRRLRARMQRRGCRSQTAEWTSFNGAASVIEAEDARGQGSARACRASTGPPQRGRLGHRAGGGPDLAHVDDVAGASTGPPRSPRRRTVTGSFGHRGGGVRVADHSARRTGLAAAKRLLQRGRLGHRGGGWRTLSLRP